MQQNAQEIEDHKKQLIGGLTEAVNSLRQAANYAEGFATLLKHSSFTPGGAVSQPFMFGNNIFGDAMNQVAQTSQPAPARGRKAPVSPVDEVDGTKKRRKAAEKKPRDPNAPKKPPSAYLLFQNAVRKDMQEKNKGKPYHEVLSEISQRWKSMTEEEKRVYNQATSEAKAKYTENKLAYDNSLNGVAPHEMDVAEAPPPPPVAKAPKAAPAVPKLLPAEPASSEEEEESSEVSETSEEDDDDEEEEEDERPPAKKAKPTAPVKAPVAHATHAHKEHKQVQERKKRVKT